MCVKRLLLTLNVFVRNSLFESFHKIMLAIELMTQKDPPLFLTEAEKPAFIVPYLVLFC